MKVAIASMITKTTSIEDQLAAGLKLPPAGVAAVPEMRAGECSNAMSDRLSVSARRAAIITALTMAVSVAASAAC